MIEDKLSRLTPGQRRKVEDYIDFLISRDNNPELDLSSGTRKSFSEIQDLSGSKTHSLFSTNHGPSTLSGEDILPDYPEYGDIESLNDKDEQNHGRSMQSGARPVIKKANTKDPSQLLDWLD